MSGGARVYAAAEDAALAGHPGEGAVAVALGDAPLPGDANPARAVRWLAAPAATGPGEERLIAPGGEGLWRRAPWPVADAVFELEPRLGGPALVAGGDPARVGFVAGELRRRGHDALDVERLTLPLLAEAAACVLLSAPGQPLPGRAFAVLAARRVLVTDRCEPAFGLLPHVDWFPGADDADVVELADAALSYPDAFSMPRALGRLAAERHRASVVYRRLARDVELELAGG